MYAEIKSNRVGPFPPGQSQATSELELSNYEKEQK